MLECVNVQMLQRCTAKMLEHKNKRRSLSFSLYIVRKFGVSSPRNPRRDKEINQVELQIGELPIILYVSI